MKSIHKKFYRIILIVSLLMVVSACKDSTDKYPFFLKYEADDNLEMYHIGHNSYEISAGGGTLRIIGSIDFTVYAVDVDDCRLAVDNTPETDACASDIVSLSTIDTKNIQITFHPNNTGKLRKIEIILHPKWDEDAKLAFWQFNPEL